MHRRYTSLIESGEARNGRIHVLITVEHGNARLGWFLVAIVGMFMLSACQDKTIPENDVFTLYTNAPSDLFARVGIATFDTNADYLNARFCNRTAELFQSDWEKGAGKVEKGVKPSPHHAPASSFRTIDSRPRTLTIPITTANSAVQSNEVYLTPCSTVPSIQLRLGVR